MKEVSLSKMKVNCLSEEDKVIKCHRLKIDSDEFYTVSFPFVSVEDLIQYKKYLSHQLSLVEPMIKRLRKD